MYLFLFVIYGSYRGGLIFLKMAQQRRGIADQMAAEFLESPPAIAALHFAYFKENFGRKRLSPVVAELYSTDTLQGYGDENFSKGGDELSAQQRGQIIPLIEKVADTYKDSSRIFVEIGIGNGDVIAYLAKKYSNHHFIGVDFSVATAQKKHGNIKNLEFKKGYILELLESNALQGDVLFASSTLTLFVPCELENLFYLLRDNGFKSVVSSEPTWGPYSQSNSDLVESYYMDEKCWYHNYCGYLMKASFRCTDFSYFPYKHPSSSRPDIFLSLLIAST